MTLNTPIRINENLVAIVNARKAAELLQFEHVDALISWGTATALTNLDSGDLVLPEYIVVNNKTRYRTDPAWHEQFSSCLSNLPITTHTGNIADTEYFLETPAQKSNLHKNTGAIAADMESAAILMVANENKLPCLVIRSIVDRDCDSLSRVITRNTDLYGMPDFGNLLADIIYKPVLVLQLTTLSCAMIKASRTLRVVARQFRDSTLQPAQVRMQ